MANILRKIGKTVLNRAGYHLVPTARKTMGDLPRDLLSDPYVEYLSEILGGWMSDDNVIVFEQAMRAMPAADAVVEIGSFLGLSTSVLAYAMEKYQRPQRFFNCDLWGYERGLCSDRDDNAQVLLSAELYQPYVRATYERNMRTFSARHLPHSLQMSSDEFFELWAKNATATDLFGREVLLGGAISFAYIDGDHGYQGAHTDFFNVDRFLLPGGLVLLDDSWRNSLYHGVHRVLDEIRQTGRYELFADRFNRAFIKRS